MDLVKLLPNRPAMNDGELNAWLMENGGRGREVLTYRKETWRNPLTEELEPITHCTCSVCDGQWNTYYYGFITGSYPSFENHDGVRHNGDVTTCPMCGAKVEVAYHRRLAKHPIVSTKYPWEIVKKDGNLMFICWAVMYEIDDYGPALYHQKRNAYVLDADGRWHRFTAMERSGWSSMSKMEYIDSWYETKKFSVPDGNFKLMLPHEPAVYEGTALENAKMEYLEAADTRTDLIQYARLYLRHPTAENITMNSPQLMAAAIGSTSRVTGLDWLNWKAAKPHEILFMEKPEYKQVTELSEDDARALINQQKSVAACMLWGVPKEYARVLGEEGIDFAFTAYKNKYMRNWSLVRLWNYVLKVAQTQEKKNNRPIESAVDLCMDYWKDAKLANFNIADPVVMFPKDVREAQARAVAAIKYATDEKLKAKFKRQAEKLAPLQWKNGGLIIVPAQDEGQLVAEGKFLGHCVGGYGEAHCHGNSIFFIRHAAKPEVPYFTLQLNTRTGVVLQNRGEKNCRRTQEVQDFEKQWLDNVVAPWLKNNQKKEKTV